jgi:putative transposase
MLQQTTEVWVLRRAQAIRAVVVGQHVSTVSPLFSLAHAAWRPWGQRFAQQGPQGLLDRPRPGRPHKVRCELTQHLNRLVDQDPRQHASLSSQWNCRALATALAHHIGLQLGRASVRSVLKK